MEVFHYYLVGWHFTLLTNHHPCSCSHSRRTLTARSPAGFCHYRASITKCHIEQGPSTPMQMPSPFETQPAQTSGGYCDNPSHSAPLAFKSKHSLPDCTGGTGRKLRLPPLASSQLLPLSRWNPRQWLGNMAQLVAPYHLPPRRHQISIKDSILPEQRCMSQLSLITACAVVCGKLPVRKSWL